MPDLPLEDPEEKRRTGLATWMAVIIGVALFLGTFLYFALSW